MRPGRAAHDGGHLTPGSGGAQFVQRTRRDESAVVHDAEPVAQAGGLLQVVRREDQRPASSAASRRRLAKIASRAGTSSPTVGSSSSRTSRLVEQGAGQVEPPLHAAGERPRDAAGPVAELHEVEDFGQTSAALGRLRP